MTQSNIYFDFNATTPIDPLVQQKLGEWLALWGNPSSIHLHGRGPKKLLRESRRGIANHLGCHPLELVFTSGGSEANNLAIKGAVAEIHKKDPKRTKILMGAIEHPSVLQQTSYLQSQGFEVLTIPVSAEGQYDLEFLQTHLDETVALVSVMLANNEVGVIAPIKKIVKLAHEVGAFVHSDMVQALGKMSFNLKEIDVDLASFSSHKIYALKGSGILYIKKGTPLMALVDGGSQERYRRAGTENLLAIASFALMIEQMDPQKMMTEIKPLRDQFEATIQQEIRGVHILCGEQKRLPNTSCFYVDGVSGESLLMNLDIRGFSVGTGAACSSGNPEPSPVLLALGLTRDQAQSSLRISMGRGTTSEQVESLSKALQEIVEHLRSIDAEEEKYVKSI